MLLHSPEEVLQQSRGGGLGNIDIKKWKVDSECQGFKIVGSANLGKEMDDG